MWPAVAAVAVWALPQQVPDRYGVVVVQGSDTTAVERVVRETGALRAEVLVPRRVRIVVSASVDARGCIDQAESRVFPWGSGEDATPIQRMSVTLQHDSVRIEATTRGAGQSVARPMRGARFVLAGESVAASLLVVECARAVGGDSADVLAVEFPNVRPVNVRVRSRGDSILVAVRDTSWVRLDAAGAVSSAVIGRNRIMAHRVTSQDLDRIAFAPPDYSAPPGAPYRAEAVTVPAADGAALAGTLTLPAGTGPFPALVTISGSGADDRDESAPIAGGYRPFRDIADTLGRRGIAVLRLDDRGVGNSTGDFGAATERTLASDTRDAIAWLRSRPDILPGRIAVLGHSEGARVAMLVAAEEDRLAGVILMAGAADPRAALMAQRRRLIPERVPQAMRDSILAAYRRQLDSLAPILDREVLRWDAAALARDIHAPVAVFQGGTDTQVPPDQADSLGAILRRAGNPDVTVRVFPQRNHLFVTDPDGDFRRYDQLGDARVAEDVRGAIADWLLARMALPPS